MSAPCCCGSGLAAAGCCDLFLAGENRPDTPEQLMRSRYAAFVQRNAAYLRASWHPDTCPERLELDPRQRWLGLKILASAAGTSPSDTAEVEFVARYKIDGRGYRLHERSRFVREDGRWLYLDGERGATDSALR